MTWREFKRIIEDKGVKNNSEIVSIKITDKEEIEIVKLSSGKILILGKIKNDS